MKEKAIWTIAVGTNPETSKECLSLAKEHPHIFATVGIHPTESEVSFSKALFSEAVEHEKTVAIGECGIDYYRGKSNSEKQKDLFCEHIEIALEYDLALMLHGRPASGTMDAYDDMLDILDHYSRKYGEKLRGNAHFFVGTIDVARRFLDLGFSLSFDGPITFTSEYNEVIKFTPLDMIMAETDSPFAAPDSHRGKRNSPLYLPEIVASIAGIREEATEVVKDALVENAFRVFDIPESSK